MFRDAPDNLTSGLLNPKTALWLGVGGIWAFAMLVLQRQNVADLDLWGVLSFGALLAVNNPQGLFTPDVYFPYRDIFSFTAHGAPWVYHEWGAGVLFYQVFTRWGSGALFLLKTALLLGTLTLAAQTGWHRQQRAGQSTPAIWVALCIGFLLFSMPYWLGAYILTIRCHTLSFFLLALVLALLARADLPEWRRPALLGLPLILMLWANVHGGFLVGLLAVGLWAANQFLANRHEPRWLAPGLLAMCFLSTLANPWGVELWRELISAWGLQRTDIHEWQTVFSISPLYGTGFVLLVLAIFTGSAADWWHHRRVMEAPVPVTPILVLLTGIEGVLHLKLMPLFVVSALAWGLSPWQGKELKSSITRQLLAGISLTGATALLIAAVSMGRLAVTEPDWLRVRVPDLRTTETPVQYPVTLTQTLENLLTESPSAKPERLWAPYGWGQYLYWHVYPQALIGIDGRYETVYPPELLKLSTRFFEDPDLTPSEALRQLKALHATLLLIPTSRPELLTALDHSRQWQLCADDGRARLYRRTGGPCRMKQAAGQPTLLYLEDHQGEIHRFLQ